MKQRFASFSGRLMLDSRGVDVRMVYTDDIPCPAIPAYSLATSSSHVNNMIC